MTRAYIGIGSNLGDKKANIEKALTILGCPGETRQGDRYPVLLLRVAPLYRTAPLGYTRQDWFINTVAELETTLPPLELLEFLLTIENEMGRRRQERWGPRLIDLDLLLYGEVVMESPKLTLPHPRMHERAFVLAPLADLAPEIKLPGHGRVAELARKLTQAQTIELYPAE